MANPSPSNSSRRSAPHPSRSGGGVSRPLYAIDFTAVACGKRIANTKRRVRWRFGFANPDALAAGETGTACRGEEHDVTMVWSVTSGKRLILADGQEVHYSNSRSAVIDFSWTMRGNHVLKVIAHATAPMSADPGFRQYDFFVDGRSFFTFPKVYRLGLSGSRTVSPREGGQRGGGASSGGNRMAESSSRRKSSSIAAIETPHNRDEEESYLAEAIKASLQDQNAKEKSAEKPKVSSEAADLLIDFMDDWNATGNTLPPAAAPAAPAGGSDQWALAPAPVQNNQWAVAPAPAAVAPPSDAWAQPAAPPAFAAAPATPAYSAAPSNPFSPPPPQQQQQQQQPNYGQQQPPPFASPQPSVGMTASVPGQFAAPPSNVFSPAPPAPAPAAPVSQPPITSNGSVVSQQPPAAPVQTNPALTMGNLSSDGLLGNGVASSGNSGSMADQALQNLMGSIDSFGITGSAAKPKNPFDNNDITNNKTLGEIKNSSPKKPVMNAPPGGAMVMSNNQSGNWGMGMQQQQQPQYGGMGMQQPQYGGYPQQQQQQYNMGMQGGMQQQPPMQGGMQQPPPMQGGMPPQYGQQQPPQWGAGGPTY